MELWSVLISSNACNKACIMCLNVWMLCQIIWWKAESSVAYVLHSIIFRSSKALSDLLPQSLHKALSLRKYSSSEWSVPSILVLYHIIHKPKSWVSFLWPQYTQMLKKQKQKKVSHSPVAETKHNPLTWIACSGKLCIKQYNTVKLGAEHTFHYAAQRTMPECQRGRERNIYSRWPAAGVSGNPLLLTKEQETGRLGQPWEA